VMFGRPSRVCWIIQLGLGVFEEYVSFVNHHSSVGCHFEGEVFLVLFCACDRDVRRTISTFAD
jgi:hypothetical protein